VVGGHPPTTAQDETYFGAGNLAGRKQHILSGRASEYDDFGRQFQPRGNRIREVLVSENRPSAAFADEVEPGCVSTTHGVVFELRNAQKTEKTRELWVVPATDVAASGAPRLLFWQGSSDWWHCRHLVKSLEMSGILWITAAGSGKGNLPDDFSCTAAGPTLRPSCGCSVFSQLREPGVFEGDARALSVLVVVV